LSHLTRCSLFRMGEPPELGRRVLLGTDQRLHAPITVTLPDTGGGSTSTAPVSPSKAGGPLATIWSGLTAVIATVMGLAPHVLHHIGLFAGAAFVVGVGGNLVFAAVGLLLSIPLLRRLYRRFGTWKAPTLAVAVFAVVFSISAFVIGPAISSPETVDAPQPAGTSTPDEHSVHHSD
jgi:hypothetical protein